MADLSASAYRSIFALLLVQAYLCSAGCECGYRVSTCGDSRGHPGTLLFTDAVQTNFREMQNLNSSDDWEIKFIHSNFVRNSGRYGKLVEEKNVILNPIADISAGWNSPSVQGSDIDAGLQLIVRSDLTEDNMVSSGQIQSKRGDVRFGSFRTYMKSTPVNGTCAAHFWYHNDSQEIDMELLSRQHDGDRTLVNLSVHSKESVANDNDARNTTGYIEGQLEFDPADGFHEYRYDWWHDGIRFYTDGRWLGDVDDFIPTQPGHFQLSHWSNGYARWSAGPPDRDALITVAYYMGYFNSTDVTQMEEYEERCGDGRDVGRVCDVPDFEASS